MSCFCLRFLILGLNIFLAVLQANAEEMDSLKVIKSIEIIRQNVFPEITGKPEFLYCLANKLHLVTRDGVIKNYLLFAKGDIFDQELIEESERRLRRLAYLGDAKIVVKNANNDSIDIEVITQDQWSTLVSAVIQSGGGRSELGGAIEEFNLFGFGKKFFTEIRHEPEGFNYTFKYSDPQVRGSRWTTDATFSTGPFHKTASYELIRPFYSLDTKWAGGVALSTSEQTLRLFEGGNESSRLDFDGRSLQLFAARAFGERFKKKRVQLTYRFAERNFSEIENQTKSIVPDDELIHGLTGRLSLENLFFVKEKQIDKFLRTEDITLGNETSIRFGRTGIPITKGIKRFELNITRSDAFKLFENQYLFLSSRFQTLFDKDTIASFGLRYYNKSLKSQTLALNFKFDYAKNLETSRQFLLGGDSGLRGYSSREFSGDKRLVFNIEDRIFTSLNILTVAFGGVVFFDAGHVWEKNEAINFNDLNYSAGIGLRLGYTKSPNSRVGRVDFAWPISGDGFGVSIGVDQQFFLN